MSLMFCCHMICINPTPSSYILTHCICCLCVVDCLDRNVYPSSNLKSRRPPATLHAARCIPPQAYRNNVLTATLNHLGRSALAISSHVLEDTYRFHAHQSKPFRSRMNCRRNANHLQARLDGRPGTIHAYMCPISTRSPDFCERRARAFSPTSCPALPCSFMKCKTEPWTLYLRSTTTIDGLCGR